MVPCSLFFVPIFWKHHSTHCLQPCLASGKKSAVILTLFSSPFFSSLPFESLCLWNDLMTFVSYCSKATCPGLDRIFDFALCSFRTWHLTIVALCTFRKFSVLIFSAISPFRALTSQSRDGTHTELNHLMCVLLFALRALVSVFSPEPPWHSRCHVHEESVLWRAPWLWLHSHFSCPALPFTVFLKFPFLCQDTSDLECSLPFALVTLTFYPQVF